MGIFKKFAENLKNLNPEPVVFNPAVLDDPIAMQTEWGAAKDGGANFRTHHLVQVDPNRLEFRASWVAKLFAMLFFFVGLGVPAVFTMEAMEGGEFTPGFELVFVLLIGAVFTVVGAVMFVFSTAPIVFDRRLGAYWRGRTAPDQTFNRLTLTNYAEFNDIHALQLIAEFLSGNRSSYYSYELNLVLKDGTRFNVVDHGDKAKIIEDAHTLAAFLDVPLWNALDPE